MEEVAIEVVGKGSLSTVCVERSHPYPDLYIPGILIQVDQTSAVVDEGWVREGEPARCSANKEAATLSKFAAASRVLLARADLTSDSVGLPLTSSQTMRNAGSLG